MKFKNFGRTVTENGKQILKKDTVRVKTYNLELNVPFGEECEVPAEYANPRRYGNGGRRPSAIEMLAPQMAPVSEEDRQVWEQTPPEEPKAAQVGRNPVAMSVAALVAQGLPQGIAETLVATYQAALTRAKSNVEQE